MDILKAEQIATDLIKHFNVNYDFKFDMAKSRFGLCDYSHRTIYLSKLLVELNSQDTVINTTLHEIAHALTPISGHNNLWRRTAKSIGCDGERCYNSNLVVRPKAKYTCKCVNGCFTIQKNRKLRMATCSKCGAKVRYTKNK